MVRKYFEKKPFNYFINKTHKQSKKITVFYINKIIYQVEYLFFLFYQIIEIITQLLATQMMARLRECSDIYKISIYVFSFSGN